MDAKAKTELKREHFQEEKNGRKMGAEK